LPIEDHVEVPLVEARDILLNHRPAVAPRDPVPGLPELLEAPGDAETSSPGGEPRLDDQGEGELGRDRVEVGLGFGQERSGAGEAGPQSGLDGLVLVEGGHDRDVVGYRDAYPHASEPLPVLREHVDLGIPGREDRVDLLPLADFDHRTNVSFLPLGVLGLNLAGLPVLDRRGNMVPTVDQARVGAGREPRAEPASSAHRRDDLASVRPKRHDDRVGLRVATIGDQKVDGSASSYGREP
jgi:hypothetical protein